MARKEPRFASWKYFRFEVSPADLPGALGLLHEKKFRGINLTVPHKVLAVEHLDAIDAAARPVGAVNTLLWTERGWHGHNTDGHGLAMALQQDLNRDLTRSHIVLLGAGGAARGAAVECLQRRCASLTIVNRTAKNLESLLELLKPVAKGIDLIGVSAESMPGRIRSDAIVINATSSGLRETDISPLDLRAIPRPACVYDMIYNPPVTPLLRTAAEQGIPHANGLSMLIHQGAKSLEIWSGAEVPVSAMQAAAERALGR
jgi:shikimate dehydrogenase